MSQPEPLPRYPYCDLCGVADALVVERVSPPFVGDRRRERFRNEHPQCVIDKRASEVTIEDLLADRKQRREANDA